MVALGLGRNILLGKTPKNGYFKPDHINAETKSREKQEIRHDIIRTFQPWRKSINLCIYNEDQTVLHIQMENGSRWNNEYNYS